MKHFFWGAAASALVSLVFVTGSCGSESEDNVLNRSKGNPAFSAKHSDDAARWKVLDEGDKLSWAAKAVGVLGDDTPCTATLIQLDDDLSEKAKLLTAGHCIGELLSNNWNGKRVLKDFSYEQDFTVPDLGSGGNLALKSKTVIYGSIVPYDIAVLVMESTYSELLEQGFRFARIADGSPGFPQKVWNIAFAETGSAVIEAGAPHLQKCRILETVAVKEYLWFWKESLALDCVTAKGSSGSPLFVTNGDHMQIFGIVNTKSTQNPLINGNGKLAADFDESKVLEGPCGIDSPCVVEGAEKIKGMSESFADFGQPVNMLTDCYNQETQSFEPIGGCVLGEPDTSPPILDGLDIMRDEDSFIISLLTQDDKGISSPAGLLHLELTLDDFPSSVPFRYSLESSEELSFDGEYVRLEFDIGNLLFGFGLDTTKPSKGSIRLRVGDESENWSEWSSPMPFSFLRHDS